MAEFVSYARNNGFSPILIPDTTERDLRQEQRNIDEQRRAYKFGKDNRQRVQNQLERNQQLESQNRQDNFELEDQFIKQQRAAEKRNWETRIKAEEQKSQNAQQLMKFASTFSATALEKTSEITKEKGEAERDFAYGLIYKYGVTSEERRVLDEGEDEMSSLQAQLNPLIADLKRRGASVEEISTLQNLSGWGRYGANKAQAERAGDDFSAYAFKDQTQYKVGDKLMTLTEAVAEGDELGVRTILDQMRPKYINEAVPGMDPIFLDKYMFDKIRTFENGLAKSAADNRLAALKSEDAANKMRQTVGFIKDPQGQGGQLWVNELNMAGKGNYAVEAAAAIARLTALKDSDPAGVIRLIDQIGAAETTNKATGQSGSFAEVNPGQWAQLTKIRQESLSTQVQQQRNRDNKETQEKAKLQKALLSDLQGAPRTQWEDQIKLLESRGLRDVADHIAQQMPNSTAEAIQDNAVEQMWEQQERTGMPVTLSQVNNRRDISTELRTKWRKKAGNIGELTSDDYKAGHQYIKAKINNIFADYITPQGYKEETVPLALEALNAEYDRKFASIYKLTGDKSQAAREAREHIETLMGQGGPYDPLADGRNPDGSVKVTKTPSFRIFTTGKRIEREDTVTIRFKQSGYKPDLVSLIPRETLISGLKTFNDTGRLPSSFAPLQLAADTTPKVNLYDVINGQIKHHQLEGMTFDDGNPISTIQDVFQPPEFDDNDLSASRQALIQYQDAKRMLDYKPNPVRSEVARISMGGIPDPQLTVTADQRAAIDAVSGPESGALGYEAVNQGTLPDGTVVNSGRLSDLPQHRGKRVVDLSLREILEIQDLGFQGSDTAWRRKGGVFAIGRYQFIPETLNSLVERYNLNLNQKFSPQLQDWLFLKYLQEVGPMAWSGVHGDAEAQAIMRAAMDDPIADFESDSPWRQPDTMNPEVSKRYIERNGN